MPAIGKEAGRRMLDAMEGTQPGIGASPRRVEDDRLLRGQGRFIDDVNRPACSI